MATKGKPSPQPHGYRAAAQGAAHRKGIDIRLKAGSRPPLHGTYLAQHLPPDFRKPPESRFRALEKLSRAGLRTGISLGPVIPGLNDSDIPALLGRAKECGAGFAFYVMLRLPGSVREVFLERIKAVLPEKAGKIEHHIREVRGGGLYDTDFRHRMSGTGTMADMVDKLFRIHARKLGLDTGERMGGPAARTGVDCGSWSGKGYAAPSGPDIPGVRQAKAKPPAPPKGKPPKGKDPGQLDLFAT